jgi:hypothetical protein
MLRLLIVFFTLFIWFESVCAQHTGSAVSQGLNNVPSVVSDKIAGELPFLTGAYREQADQTWRQYQINTRASVQKWASAQVKPGQDRMVFYPFSGPDFVTVAALFPEASHFVMVAMQPAGQPAALKYLSASRQETFQAKFLREWKKFARLGFFRTDDLNQDVGDQQAQIGVSTILMTFALYSGYEITDIYPIMLDPKIGQFEQTQGPWHSVRLRLLKNGKHITLDYISTNLSDKSLTENLPMLAWLEKASAHPTLIKAASHLLQMTSFSVLRDMILANSPMVVQDETGLDYTDLSKIGVVNLYGGFLYPHELFNRNRQSSLAMAYKQRENEVKPLPFAFSYNKSDARRCMQIVHRNTVGS